MSWLSSALNSVEGAFSSIGSDIGSFVSANESWLLPAALGVGAIATGGLLAPELFGAFGAAEAGGEAAAGLGAAEIGAEAGAGAGAAEAGAVDISISPFVEGAAAAGEAGAADVGTAAGLGAEDIAGVTGAGIGDISPGIVNAAADVGATDALGATGADALGAAPGFDLSTVPVAGLDTGTGLQGGTDIAAAQADVLGPGSTGAQAAAGEPLGAYPTETAGQAFQAGRFGSFATPDLGVAQQDTLAGGLLGQGPLGPSDQALAAAALPPPTTVPSNVVAAPAASEDIAGTTAQASIANPTPTTGGGSNLADDISNAGGPALSLSDKASGALGGVGNFFNSPGGNLLKYGVPLGMLGANLIKGPDKLPQTTRANVDIANQEASFAAGQREMAQAGQIDPSQEQQLQNSAREAKAKLYQQYAQRGVDPNSNTDYIQAVQAIDNQTNAARAAYIQQMLQNALNADSAASQVLNNAATQQIQLDQQFNAATSSALQSFGLIAGLSAGKGGTGGAAAATPPTG